MNNDLTTYFSGLSIQREEIVTNETDNNFLPALRIDTAAANTASRVNPQTKTLLSPFVQGTSAQISPLCSLEEKKFPEIEEDIQQFESTEKPVQDGFPSVVSEEIAEEIVFYDNARFSPFEINNVELDDAIKTDSEFDDNRYNSQLKLATNETEKVSSRSAILSEDNDYSADTFESEQSNTEEQTSIRPSTPRQLGLNNESALKNLAFLGRGSFGEASKVKNQDTIVKVHYDLKPTTLARETINIVVDEMLLGTQQNNIAISRHHFKDNPLVTSSPYKGRPLLEARKKLSLDQAIRAILPEAKDIAKTHQMGLSCGDIKTDNTLYQNGRLKGIDRSHNALGSDTAIQKTILEKAMNLFNRSVGQYKEGMIFKDQLPAAITHALTTPVDTPIYQPPEYPESGKENDLAKKEVYSFAMTIMEFLSGEKIAFRSDGAAFENSFMPQIPIVFRMISTTGINLSVNKKGGTVPDILTFDFKTIKTDSSDDEPQYSLEIRLPSSITATESGLKIVKLLKDMTQFQPKDRIDMATVVKRLSEI